VYEWVEILRSGRTNSEQNDAGLLKRGAALNRNLPKILVERQHDARFGFGRVQKDNVFPASAIGAGPKDVVAVGAKGLDDWLREVFISEEAHLRWNRIGLVFVGQVAGVGQTGKNVVSRQPGVVRFDLAFGLAGRQEFEYELDGETRPSDHWFAGQDTGIHDDALGKRHTHSLPCQFAIRGQCRCASPILFDWFGYPGRMIGSGWHSLAAASNG